MALNAKKAGSPVDFVFPAEGVSSITQPIGIIDGTDNLDGAKAFVDWQLSRAAQEQSVAQGYFPIFDGIAPPAGYPEVSSLKILPLDADRMLADDEANKKEFADLFGG
jgi:iron(III) transport system substrate-binding protein